MTPTIGIIGGGNLGRTLASAFRQSGIADILVSHAGNPATLAAIRDEGLEKNLADNIRICQHANIIFITVRPQSAASLDDLPFSKNNLVVSCMAGIPAAVLCKRWGIPVVRMMPSGPETIRNKNGIAAVYPENQTLEYLLARLGLKVYTLPDEELMHVFTAGVCLPAALCEGKARRMNIDGEMQRICRKYPLLSEIYPWAQKVLPAFGSDSEREAYAGMMNTKGGVTEAIIASIRSGRTFSQAVEAGIERSKAISEQCSP